MIETLDLTKKEDLEKFHEYIDEIKSNGVFKTLAELIGLDEETLDAISNLVDVVYDESEENEEAEISVPSRPSEKLSTEEGLQLHKLVGEYVDTMIRPYANDNVDDNTINDAYAGLYEFAAWLLKK